MSGIRRNERSTELIAILISDYPRTLREWGRRLEKNLTQEMIAKDFPALKNNRAEFEAFKRKWQYLYAYAGAGFAKGYITCHMLTFIRQVRASLQGYSALLLMRVLLSSRMMPQNRHATRGRPFFLDYLNKKITEDSTEHSYLIGIRRCIVLFYVIAFR